MYQLCYDCVTHKLLKHIELLTCERRWVLLHINLYILYRPYCYYTISIFVNDLHNNFLLIISPAIVLKIMIWTLFVNNKYFCYFTDTPKSVINFERQIKFERAQKCLENAALVSKRIKEHRKATAELLGRPFGKNNSNITVIGVFFLFKPIFVLLLFSAMSQINIFFLLFSF